MLEHELVALGLTSGPGDGLALLVVLVLLAPLVLDQFAGFLLTLFTVFLDCGVGGQAQVFCSVVGAEVGTVTEYGSVLLQAASLEQFLTVQDLFLGCDGFAVVADEIRKLAEDSATQGKSITTTLKDLSAEIETLSVSSGTVGENFTAIFNLTEQVKEMSGRLTDAMKEQEKGSGEVLAAIKDINAVTAEVKSGSSEMLKGGEQVAEEMHKLDDLTRFITNNMNEMASGAVQINRSVQEVNTVAQQGKTLVENLTNAVNKFQIK